MKEEMDVFEQEYLSEEELMALILEVEENDMVIAPPDMIEAVLEMVDAKQEEQQDIGKNELPEDRKVRVLRPPEERKKEYRRYCLQVITTMAAAILLLIGIPSILRMGESSHLLGKEYSKTETNIPTKEEYMASQKIPTREEASQKESVFEKLGSTYYIQDGLDAFKLFKKE